MNFPGDDVEEFCRQHPEVAQALRNELQSALEIGSILDGPAVLESTQTIPLPDSLSGHKIQGVIGRGGMGQVLLGFDERLGRRVAIKTLHPKYASNGELRTRFMQEARASAGLNHPNIVRIFNLGEQDEIPHFVMEYVEGKPLNEAAAVLGLEQKLLLMHQVLLAVAHLHQHGLVHRDLKPGNILVGPDLQPRL